MIRHRHVMMSAIAAVALLSGCSGGDDDDSTATPTPTTSPTPTPTASPTYAALPITTASEFVTIDATTSYTGDVAGAVTLGAAGTEQRNNRVSLALGTTVASGTFVVHENTEESRFTSTSNTVPSATSNPEYVFRTDDTTTAGKFAQLEFLNNTLASTVTSDSALALTTVSYANWWRGDSTTGQKRLTYTVFGYPTVATDLPTTGTSSYTARVVGRLVSVTNSTSVLRVTGNVTLSVNFATGVVDMTLALSTIGDGGVTTPYGTFTAQGSYPAGQNQFTGSFTTGSPLSGTFSGGFFGSQGKEIGLAFAAAGTNGGAQQRLIGDVVGKK